MIFPLLEYPLWVTVKERKQQIGWEPGKDDRTQTHLNAFAPWVQSSPRLLWLCSDQSRHLKSSNALSTPLESHVCISMGWTKPAVETQWECCLVENGFGLHYSVELWPNEDENGLCLFRYQSLCFSPQFQPYIQAGKKKRTQWTSISKCGKRNREPDPWS